MLLAFVVFAGAASAVPVFTFAPFVFDSLAGAALATSGSVISGALFTTSDLRALWAPGTERTGSSPYKTSASTFRTPTKLTVNGLSARLFEQARISKIRRPMRLKNCGMPLARRVSYMSVYVSREISSSRRMELAMAARLAKVMPVRSPPAPMFMPSHTGPRITSEMSSLGTCSASSSSISLRMFTRNWLTSSMSSMSAHQTSCTRSMRPLRIMKLTSTRLISW